MQKNKKQITLILIFSISIIILTWCWTNTNNIENTENTENNSLNLTSQETNTQEQQKLVIHNGCIWCGKCIRIAPQNFTMNWRMAEVSSQEDINNSNVKKAINHCPVSVIELIEI